MIIPTFNRESLLNLSVESVLSQSVDFEFEVIVVNDFNKRLTFNDFLSNHKVVVVESNECKGAANARNIGCLASNSDFVVFLDDDDVMKSGYLKKLNDIIKNSSRINEFYYCGVDLFELVNSSKVYVGSRVFKDENDTLDIKITNALSIGTGFGLTVRTETLKKIGYFNVGYKYIEDTEFILRLVESGVEPVSICSCYIEVLKHSDNQLTSSKNNIMRANECLRLLDERKEFFDINSLAKEQLHNSYNYLVREYEV